jgi:hypothetical protein
VTALFTSRLRLFSHSPIMEEIKLSLLITYSRFLPPGRVTVQP